jgi:hypothetical protein
MEAIVAPCDSAPLLTYLYAQFARFEYTWRHRWEVGDLMSQWEMLQEAAETKA